MIPIPTGRKYTAKVTGSVTKSVRCEKCHRQYNYAARRVGIGSGNSVLFLDNEGARRRADRDATKDLERTLAKAIEPVPCPNCRWYQRDMVRLVKRRQAIAILLSGLGVAVITTITLFVIAIMLAWLALVSLGIQIFLGLGILSILSSGIWFLFCDPNKRSNSKFKR